MTDSTVEPSMSATSVAWYPSTSRRISTARWRGGRSCNAVTKASEIASFCSYRACGSATVDGTLAQYVGIRLEPYDLAQPCRLGHFHIGDVPLLGW